MFFEKAPTNQQEIIMKTTTKLFLNLLCGLAVAPAVFGQGSTATISGVPNGANWDYTITLKDTGTTQIGNFWYAWTPDVSPFFYLPAGTINNISGQNGWTGATSANSIQYVDNSSANALNPGDSVELFYTASFSPTTLAATANSGLSVAYSGSGTFVENGASTGDFTVSIVSAPEPSSAALLIIGIAGLVLVGWRKLKNLTAVA
jgi:PEP-CTERM motif